ncbi:MAG TPA: hydrogenase maturation protease [Streptosporangiaceae bacterium]|nr:hydrogenase maturation protease [Streptosporangiaceae bacterium]
MTTPRARGPVVIIGVGNEYRRDDGVGPRVLELLGDPPGVRLAVCDGEPARLIGLWEDAGLAVVVDAVRGDRPGRIHELDLDSVGGHHGNPSSHALGLEAAVELAAALERLPGRLAIVAVEAADFRLGAGLSPPVAAALPALAARVARLAGVSPG